MSANRLSSRIHSIDVARGAVMVLMAIDHVRVFSGVPAGGVTADIFLTRWVTNFCAPGFVFFAGVSIFLHGHKLENVNAQSRWLFLRGAWLVLLELTFLRLAWTFNLDFAHYMLAGVIWMLGWCMILMGLLIRLPVWANAVLGMAIVAGHNIIPAGNRRERASDHERLAWLVVANPLFRWRNRRRRSRGAELLRTLFHHSVDRRDERRLCLRRHSTDAAGTARSDLLHHRRQRDPGVSRVAIFQYLRRSSLGSETASAGVDFIPEHIEVPSFVSFSVDDARAYHRGPAIARKGAG